MSHRALATACLALLAVGPTDAEPPEASRPSPAPSSSTQQVAGYIFDTPVPADNYNFAKRVAALFPRPWEEHLSPADHERAIWEALILHFESFRRGVVVSNQELEERINGVLKDQQQTFTRSQDPEAYATWAHRALNEDVAVFENQMRYLFQIDKLKDTVRQSLPVAVTDEEMRQEFLNEKNHVAGEMAVFDTQEEADAFYARVKDPKRWEGMKAAGDPKIRPVSLMTLEAYMDLWGIPKDQMYAFHALDVGSVGAPMPFGKQWCVYRLLDKRTGDLKDFPKEREAYSRQLTTKRQYEALKQWIEALKTSARLKISH